MFYFPADSKGTGSSPDKIIQGEFQMNKFAAVFIITLIMGSVGPCFAQSAKTVDIKGDAGTLSVSVPSGWADDDFGPPFGGNDPYGVKVYKGKADEMTDLFYAPAVNVSVYPKGEMFNKNMSKEKFTNASDLASVQLGNYTWKGYTGVFDDYPTSVLWAEQGANIIEARIDLETRKGKITLNDADVQLIIKSITLK